MAEITRIQIANINEKCDNGFELDVSHYIATGEIQLIKYVDVCENIRYEFCLVYRKKCRAVKNKGKIEKLIQTHRYIVMIEISKWTRGESLDVWINQGIKLKVTSNKFTVDNKTLKYLQKLTHELDNEILLSFIDNI